ncbi:Gfo/Idh/MocA family oxidoreductase [Candidatus Bathyarchaeota archaeon]|nr:Gfo/Idh/MocA family oxidoreductase [Candidatus Bathyarchaeota archaeon]MBS7617300.1 Gfo/Idh/MocA family oxidoreductase [Candidatus Bathyarchaeota archaeon]
MVNVGIIGCGGIMRGCHIPILAKMSNVKLIAFCDVEIDRAKESAQMYKANAYADYREMLLREKLDAVFIAVPPYAHGFEVEVVEKGVHVFVEKPVALDLNTARRVEKAIQRSGVVNSVGYMWRYLDTTDKALEVLMESGPVVLVEGHYVDPFWLPLGHWWLSKSKGGGQVVEQATHVFDLARFLTGDVERVYAEFDYSLIGKYAPGSDVEDCSITVLKFKSGAIGVITATCISRNTYNFTDLKILAEKTVLEHGGHRGFLRVYRHNSIEEHRPRVDPYALEDEIFIEAVKKGDTSKIRSTYSDAVKTLEITLAANESSRAHKPVEL